jgi:hypothetical protein
MAHQPLKLGSRGRCTHREQYRHLLKVGRRVVYIILLGVAEGGPYIG